MLRKSGGIPATQSTDTGVKWKWISGSNLPDINKVEKPNSEARVGNNRFPVRGSDNTTIIGEHRELNEGVQIVKHVMESFEQKNNEDKEEKAFFGTTEADEIRRLGCWLGPKQDVKNRIKRAGMLWTKVRGQLQKSKIPKRKQAQIVQTCVESGLLFNCAVRPWYANEKVHAILD